jgi:sodium pump decarboxylase gamma subunit
MEKINFGTALGISLIGFLTVFIVLILLMAIIWVMGKVMNKTSEQSKAETAAPAAPAPTREAPPAVEAKPAKGSCGELTLVKVSERDAAMIMAIVANQINTPLNELRFISIKEAE